MSGLRIEFKKQPDDEVLKLVEDEFAKAWSDDITKTGWTDEARAAAMEAKHAGNTPMGAKDEQGHYIIPGGQGQDEGHTDHPLAPVAARYGYKYSHSTPVHMKDGSVVTHHTFARGEHKIGVSDGSDEWDTKTSSGSGHSHSGKGADALGDHLKSKAGRYPELSMRGPRQGGGDYRPALASEM
jgi:hypothetical protein